MRRFRWLVAGVIVSAAALVVGQDAAEPVPAQPPQWFLDHVELMTRDGGRWVADNSAYTSEQETDTAYGIEWEKGPGGASMSGRLFGLRDGKETNEYWQMREFWHPGRGRVVAQQWGAWAFGEGEGERDDAGVHHITQTFHTFDGATSRQGHRSRNPDADTHETEAFEINDEGEWVPRRTYTWKREAGSQPEPEPE